MSNHGYIPILIQRRALQSRILKMETYKKKLTSPLYVQDREDCRSSRISTAPGKLAAMIQERGVTAKRTQADRSEGLMSNSSQETRASGKPAAIFSSGIEEPGNLIKSSIFKNADPSNLWKSLLEGNKNHLLSQARSDLMKQELQVKSMVGQQRQQISELQFDKLPNPQSFLVWKIFRDAGREDCFCSEQDNFRIPSSRRRSV